MISKTIGKENIDPHVGEIYNQQYCRNGTEEDRRGLCEAPVPLNIILKEETGWDLLCGCECREHEMPRLTDKITGWDLLCGWEDGDHERSRLSEDTGWGLLCGLEKRNNEQPQSDQ